MTTTNPVNIAIMGANGRMGRMLIASTKHHKEAVLSACFVRKLDAEHLPSDLPFATLVKVRETVLCAGIETHQK